MATGTRISVEVYTERLVDAFSKLRSGGKIVKTLTDSKLDLGTLRMLHEAGLLELISSKGRLTFYRYPEPNTQDGNEAIEIMAQHLHDHPRKSYYKNKKKAIAGNTSTVGIKVKGKQPTPFLNQTTTEEVMMYAGKILLAVQAPLGKNMPANFMKEMFRKDQLIKELQEENIQLRKELAGWDKQAELALQRKGKK